VFKTFSSDHTSGFVSKRYIAEFVMDIHSCTCYI
jgi:hypothetical protein